MLRTFSNKNCVTLASPHQIYVIANVRSANIVATVLAYCSHEDVMKKFTQAVLVLFAMSVFALGCANKGETKPDTEETESAREIQPAASGGMQRMEEEEVSAALEEAAPAESTDLSAPDEAPAPTE